METVSSKITRIKNAVENIRTVVEMPNNVIEDLASGINNKIGTLNNTINAKDEEISSLNTTVSNQNATIAELEEYIKELEQSGSAEKTNIYRVSTIVERDSITDMAEGDMCVVISGNIDNATVDSKFQTAKFPATVVLPIAITDYVDVRYGAVDTSVMFDGFGSLDASMFMLDCYTDSGSINIQYTSSDGITYTRTTTEEDIDFGTIISYSYPDMWNDVLGYFIQVGSVAFEGLFTYSNSAWDYSDIGINTKPSQLAPNTKAYVNSGTIEGSMGASWDTRETIDKAYSLLSTVAPTGLTDISFLYANTNLEYYPSAQLIDTSEVTNMRSLFSGCSNLKKIDLSSYNTSKVTNMSQLFKTCTSIEEINLEGFDISNVTNYSEMFYNCSSLKKLNISTMDFTGKSASTWMFGNTPNDCLIIVKDETAKNFVLACKTTFTNIQIKS